MNSDLSVPDHPEIFAIGDTAHVVAHSRNLLGIKSRQPMLMPGVAQPAIQEGRYVARLIRSRVAGTKPPRPFWYWDSTRIPDETATSASASRIAVHVRSGMLLTSTLGVGRWAFGVFL